MLARRMAAYRRIEAMAQRRRNDLVAAWRHGAASQASMASAA